MKLFEPITIRGIEFKNRVIYPATFLGVGIRGKRAVDYYTERARGGVGAIILAGTIVDAFANEETWGGAEGLNKFIASIKPVVDAVHKEGAKIGIQLLHFNRYPAGLTKGLHGENIIGEPVAPSARVEPHPDAFWLSPKDEFLRELTISEIKDIIDKFGRAVARVKETGADFVELHAAHGYMVNQFFSPIYNRRKDEYGGSLENRMRFALDCIRAMRKGAGDDFIVCCRMGAVERMVGGIVLEDSAKLAVELEKAGADILNVSTADHLPFDIPTSEFPRATLVSYAEAIKQKVNIPVIAVGRINTPELAEAILAEGKADLIAIGRQHITDPHWVHKAQEGRTEDIIPCISCNKCLEAARGGKRGLNCSINPISGKESEVKITPANKKKKVVVVGGGPAGSEAALVAAERGHRVILFEKSDKLGGQLQLAAKNPAKSEVMKDVIKYYTTQLKKKGVEVRLSCDATPELIGRENPDAVVIATGVKPFLPEISGIDLPHVVNTADVLTGQKEAGQRVAIIGGELTACDTAEFLADQGKKVFILRRGAVVASDLIPPVREQLIERLKLKGATLLTGVQSYEEITEDGVIIIDRDGQRRVISADTIVLAAGLVPNQELYGALKDSGQEVWLIGDSLNPRDIRSAIEEGNKAGRSI